MSDAAAALSPVDTGEGDNGAPVDTGSPWYGEVSEDTAAYIQNKGWENPSQLLDSYRNLEKFNGGAKNFVEIPGVDADDATMSNFYDRLGRPGSPNDYGLEMPENGDPQLMDWFTNTAHRLGMSQKQTEQFFNEYNEMSGSMMENMHHEMKVQAENDINALKREWGADYDKMIDSGRVAARGLGYDEEQLSNLEERMGTGEMLKLFATLGSKIGEDNFVTGQEGGNGFGASPAQAASEIAELKSDKQFMDAYLGGDRAAIDKMQRLMDKAYS